MGDADVRAKGVCAGLLSEALRKAYMGNIKDLAEGYKSDGMSAGDAWEKAATAKLKSLERELGKVHSSSIAAYEADHGEIKLAGAEEPVQAKPVVVEKPEPSQPKTEPITPAAETAGRAELDETPKFSTESKGPANPSDVKTATEALTKAFNSPAFMKDRVGIAHDENDPQVPADVRKDVQSSDGKVQAVFDPKTNKVWLFANNIPRGRELSVALHEVGVHMGMKNLLGNEHYGKLIDMLHTWGLDGSGEEGRLARAARERVLKAEEKLGKKYDQETFNEEHLAYFVEEAVKSGIDPTAVGKTPMQQWFRTLWAAVKDAVRKLGMNPEKLTAQHVVDMAYGAAHLEMNKGDAHEPVKPGAEQGAQKFSLRDTEEQIKSAPKGSIVRQAADSAVHMMGPTGEKVVADTTHTIQKSLLQMKFLHDIVRGVKDILPSAKTFHDHLLAMQETRNEIIRKVEVIGRLADTLDTAGYKRANEFINASTSEQKWGYAPKGKAATVDAEMQRRFNQLKPAEQDLVKAVFAHGEDIKAQKDKLFESLGVKGILGKTGTLDGPYAPLRRFGTHIAVLKSKELIAAEKLANAPDATAAQRKEVDRLKADDKHFLSAKRETRGAANQFLKEHRANFAHGDVFSEPSHAGQLAPTDIKSIERVMAALKADEKTMPKEAYDAMKQTVTEMFQHAVEQQDARQSGLKRKNAGGYDADAMRSFVHDAHAQASLIANLKHGGDINDALLKMRGETVNKDTGMRQGQDEFNAIAEHYAMSLKHNETPIQNFLKNTTSVMQLSTSLGYHLNNFLQGVMVHVPRMAADYNYKDAWAHLMSGYKLMHSITDDWGRHTDLNLVKDAKLRDVLEHARGQGLLDVGMEGSLGHFGRTRTGYAYVDGTSKAMSVALNKLRGVSRAVETWNRVSSATAAYTLAVKHGADHATAKEYAINSLRETQGDFTRTGTPLVLKKLPPVVAQYKNYQFMMMSYYAKAFMQAFRGANAAEKTLGRRTLAFKLFHTAIASGALGLPLMNMASIAYNWFNDEADNDPRDMETAWHDKIAEMSGSEAAANLLTHGLGSYVGLSAKLDEAKTFSLLPYADFDISSKAGFAEMTAAAIGGPAYGLGQRMVQGVSYMRQGDLYKGVEKMSPSGLENAMKGFRLANEGYTLKNGDVVVQPEDLSAFATFMTGLGMQPAQVNEIVRNEGIMYTIDRFYKDKTKQLEADYVRARKNGDDTSDIVRDWIAMQNSKRDMRGHFNDVQGVLKPQPLSTLYQAPQRQVKRERLEQREVPAND